MLRGILQHPLIALFKKLKGNPKPVILMEPLWGIPFNLIAPFATLFMYTQGVTDSQIGLILMLSMFAQMIFSFLGGAITDKVGRMKAHIFSDLVGWVIPPLIWAVSNNFWLFLLAALINSIEMINMAAWFCLLVEDAEEDDMVGIFNWITIGGLVSVFFAPIAGILIHYFTLVPVVRALYIIWAVFMIFKVIMVVRFCTETGQGKIRLEETKDTSLLKLLAGNKAVIVQMFKNKEIMKVLSINVILRITLLITSTFFGIYLTQVLHLRERYLAFFPILNALVMLLFLIGLDPIMEKLPIKVPLWIGIVLTIFSNIILILLPSGALFFAGLTVFLTAVANALISPRMMALLQLTLDAQERARMNSLVSTFTIGFTAPFGFISGHLSELDRRLPFMLAIGLFFLALVIVAKLKKPHIPINEGDELS